MYFNDIANIVLILLLITYFLIGITLLTRTSSVEMDNVFPADKAYNNIALVYKSHNIQYMNWV